MSSLVHYTSCPVCGSQDLHPLFTVHDHTVSHEDFLLISCASCTHRFTQDIPGPESIGRYYKAESYISHTNSSKGLINRLYKVVRGFTLAGKRKWVEGFTRKREGRVLDIGAGTGYFLAEMKSHSWETFGLEPDTDAREVCRQTHGITLQEMTAIGQLPAHSFDAITLWHVLEHVHDLEVYVKHFSTLLKPQGVLFIAVPNHTSYDALRYAKDWAAYDVPRHLHHFSPTSMKTLFAGKGFSWLGMKPMYFDAFYVSLLSSQYRSGKTQWLSAFFTGLRSNLNALFNREKCSSLVYVWKKED